MCIRRIANHHAPPGFTADHIFGGIRKVLTVFGYYICIHVSHHVTSVNLEKANWKNMAVPNSTKAAVGGLWAHLQ